MSQPARQQWVLAGLTLACLLVVGVALAVEPDSRGYGTHEAIGFPPCGMMFLTEVPCPSCGMTTAFAHAARLQIGSAARAHPCGLVLFGSVVLTGLVSVAGLMGKPSPDRLDRWVQTFPWWWAGIGFFVVFFLVWGYRVLEALLS